MANIDTHDREALTGAVYFVVGRGTEGGPSSYHLSIAGLTHGLSEPAWGDASRVVANSGYSIGTIQVDLGQRGAWPLGACENRPKRPGEKSYVDAIIDQASTYAKEHKLPFTDNLLKLRGDLLSHGNGRNRRPTISFIDASTRDSINAWASSVEGRQWIHKNIDYPQVRDATGKAASLTETYGAHIETDRRFETISILAKTANQMPSELDGLKTVMERGGAFQDVLERAQDIHRRHGYYAGPKVAALAEKYEDFYGDPARKALLDKAHLKVGRPDYDPSKEGHDPDIRMALQAVGLNHVHDQSLATLRHGSHGRAVEILQTELNELGYLDAVPDGRFGSQTKAALQAFQHDHGLAVLGVEGPATRRAIQLDMHALQRHSPSLFPKAGVASGEGPGLDDPRNVLNSHHGLFATLSRRIPDASEERLLQFTAACRSKGITAENLGRIHLDEKAMTLTFLASWPPGAVAEADLKQPPPQTQQCVHQIQAFDQLAQQVQHHAASSTLPNGPILASEGGPGR